MHYSKNVANCIKPLIEARFEDMKKYLKEEAMI